MSERDDLAEQAYITPAYTTLDCRDGQHSACATCSCPCHWQSRTEATAVAGLDQQTPLPEHERIRG